MLLFYLSFSYYYEFYKYEGLYLNFDSLDYYYYLLGYPIRLMVLSRINIFVETFLGRSNIFAIFCVVE